MNCSPSIAALAASLSKAQSSIEGAKKDSTNPHFRSKYADLASVWDACRAALTSNGLSIIQLPGKDEGGYFLETILAHSSGEWIASKLVFVPVKDDPQGLGSALTYARRYGLSAIVGIAPEDDDAEASHGRGETKVEGTPVKTVPLPQRPAQREKPAAPAPAQREEKYVPATAADDDIPF